MGVYALTGTFRRDKESVELCGGTEMVCSGRCSGKGVMGRTSLLWAMPPLGGWSWLCKDR